jgi:uncharacterized YccA/Bax inhibitor family protein
MNTHLAMRSANPALGAEAFRGTRVLGGADAMTIEGAVNKTAVSLAVLAVAAWWPWSLGAGDPRTGGLMTLGFLVGFVVAIVTVFKQSWAPITTPIYAAFEGLALGGASALFEARAPGIASQAVFLTFGTLGGLLLAYRSGVVRATDKFKLGVAAATFAIAAVYLVELLLGLFGRGIPWIEGSGAVSVGFSVIVVGIAALNLVLDFDFIEQGAERGAPKYMEWYAAFALLVTLVWLYIEILRLLAKLQQRD